MPREKVLETNEEAVAQIREKWEHPTGSGRRASKPFDHYLSLFQSNLTIEEIARESGVTAQNVCRIYNAYFRDIFGGDGRYRQHQLTLVRKKLCAHKHFTSKERVGLRRVARMAEQRGLPTETILCESYHEPNGRVSKQVLKIAGKICQIHRLRNSQQTNPRSQCSYIHTTLGLANLRRAEFSIFICRPRHSSPLVFIIPNSFLIEKISGGRRRGVRQFYLPTRKRRPRNGRKPKVNFWQFKNAWHLLIDPEESWNLK